MLGGGTTQNLFFFVEGAKVLTFTISSTVVHHIASVGGMSPGAIEMVVFYLRQGLNYHYFHIIGDGKLNPIVGGLYTHYKDSY